MAKRYFFFGKLNEPLDSPALVVVKPMMISVPPYQKDFDDLRRKIIASFVLAPALQLKNMDKGGA